MLTVHRGTDGTVLARALADVLQSAPADPFVADVVAVPAKGVERWLAQQLAGVLGATDGDGVCANVDFPWPGAILDAAVQAASPEADEAVTRWAPAQARWSLLSVLDELLAQPQPWSQILVEHLGERGLDRGRRLGLAHRLARLFDEYGRARPEMLHGWAVGRDEVGDGRPLVADLRWQAEVWRRLRTRLGPSPAETLADACRRLRAAPELSTLPGRVSLFGASRLSVARLRVLAALAEHREIHLWLHHASPALWRAVAAAPPVVLRSADRSATTLHNPLLTSLSRDIRELQHQLRHCAPGFSDVVHEGLPPTGTLLGLLQRGLAEDAPPPAPGQTRPDLLPDDRSVQLHSCHGRTRQVEVLREVVLGLLADDPTLEPRDILVMCPDIETFAPILAAAFALGSDDDTPHPASRLRVRLADRALTQTNGLLAVLTELLELGTARLTASQLLDLAGAPAVRARFGFQDDDLERLRDWVVGADIRWGLHREHRAGWDLADLDQGTWRVGLDRLLLGITQSSCPREAPVAPLDDVDSADIDLAGRFAEFLDRVDAAWVLLAGTHGAQDWLAGLTEAVLGLATPGSDAAWQVPELRAELAELAEGAAGNDAPLTLPDIRGLLRNTLAGRPTRASFRTGTLTVCTMVPMRSVPHRVVCLLGLDDGVFPRQSTRDGDDVLARDPQVGERDPRSEDRQLLLDAISATGQTLVLTFTGADERTGAPVPPAVPVDELLDALDRVASGPPTLDGKARRVRELVVTSHPLQPFDPRYFSAATEPRSLAQAWRPFSFDPTAYAAAGAYLGPRATPAPFLPTTLSPLPPQDVALADLLRLLEHPARGFLRQRLGVALTRSEQEPGDTVPIELDSLELWSIGEQLLADRLAGLDPAACIELAVRRGGLPPGAIGLRCLREVGRDVERVVQASAEPRLHSGLGYDVDVQLPDGTRLTGTVPGVHGAVVLSSTYSRLGARHRLRAWVSLVALTASSPGGDWRAMAVGRGRDGAAVSRMGPLTEADTGVVLGQLVALYRAGLRAPLPLPVKTAGEYAFLRSRGTSVHAARIGAAKKWETARFPGEQSDAEHVLVHGESTPLAVLVEQQLLPEEGGPGWAADETDRFGLLARRLWARLLDAEAVGAS